MCKILVTMFLLPPYDQVWRHTCLSLDRTTGMFHLVEDGVLRYKRELSQDDVELLQDVGDSGNIFTLGCMYWNRVNKYMTMLGSVTDAQVFSRILEEEEMISFTTCKQNVEIKSKI